MSSLAQRKASRQCMRRLRARRRASDSHPAEADLDTLRPLRLCKKGECLRLQGRCIRRGGVCEGAKATDIAGFVFFLCTHKRRSEHHQRMMWCQHYRVACRRILSKCPFHYNVHYTCDNCQQPTLIGDNHFITDGGKSRMYEVQSRTLPRGIATALCGTCLSAQRARMEQHQAHHLGLHRIQFMSGIVLSDPVARRKHRRERMRVYRAAQDPEKRRQKQRDYMRMYRARKRGAPSITSSNPVTASVSIPPVTPSGAACSTSARP